MSHKSRFLVLPALLAASLSQACGDAPLLNAPDATDTDPRNFVLTDEAGAAFAIALEDARVRLLPVLADAPAAAALRQALDGLSAAFTARDRPALVHALARTEGLLDFAARADTLATAGPEVSGTGVAADLEAVRLILTAARPLLGPGSGPATH